jgi:HEAT repeats
MNSWRISLVLLAAGALTLPAPAGILFGKKTKPNPAERVPELIVIVKTDKDESKRVAAAEELRQYDPAGYPDMVPVLIDVLMNDSKPAVRTEAAETLGKLRPVSQEAGWALEQAQEKDSSWRVRTKARYVLMTYHWAGYHTDPKLKDGPAIPNPKDQPGDKGKVVTPAPGGTPPATGKVTPDKIVISPVPVGQKAPASTPVRPITGETPAPPLADPGTTPAPFLTPRPLPTGPIQPPVPVKINSAPLQPIPVAPPVASPKIEPAPLPAIPPPPADGGPSLNGPGE